jgi:predicted pyridoxine 5'-phosphate oxidase superfamily flavin-nucleotide-binding protein
MGAAYAKTMFSAAAKRLQEQHGSRAQYERLAERGEIDEALGPYEREFIGLRDSFYLASITENGWPYMQHRGGPKGFLRVLDGKTLAFADFAGNKQYITAGNLATNDRVALFLMDYPQQARLKVIGHARVVEGDKELDAKVKVEGYKAVVERVVVIEVVAFDWNCSQHIMPRWTAEEIEGAMGAGATMERR